jgi:hypothetical protein
MSSLHIKKITILIIAEVAMLIAIYMALMYFRFSQFGNETFAGCFELGLDTTELQNCMYEVVAYYMNDSNWMAVQYVLLVLPATLLAYLYVRKIPNNLMTHVFFVSSISTILIWLVLTPPLMASLAAFTGIPLGGLMAKSRVSKIQPVVS